VELATQQWRPPTSLARPPAVGGRFTGGIKPS
jgi:hypothetical protein